MVREGRTDPGEILATQRILPAGYWKGSALSIGLDLMAAALSMGRTVSAIGADPRPERGLSQVFVAMDFRALLPAGEVDRLLDAAIDDLLASTPVEGGAPIHYPGQKREETIRRNLAQGLPVNEQTWDKILGWLDQHTQEGAE